MGVEEANGDLGTLNIGCAEARINRGIALGLAIGVLIAGYGCAGDSGERGGAAGGADLPVAWELDPVPLMTVGDAEGDLLYEVAGIVITDRHVVIAQESTGTLRFYDHGGSLDTEVGGRGEGPGEFGDLDWLQRVGDHLFAYDRDGREVSRYSLDGRLLGTVALSPPEEYLAGLSALGVFADGSLLADKAHMDRPTEPAVGRPPETLLLFDEEGEFAHYLLEMAGAELWYEPVSDTRWRQMLRLFGRIGHAAVVDSVFVVLENDSYDIPVYGRDGVARDTLRPATVRELTPLTRSRADFSQQVLLDSWDQELGSGRGEVERSLAAMGPPEYLPPYGWFSLLSPHHPPMTVADGLVWALRYGGLPREDGGADGPEWFVFEVGEGQIAALSSPDDVVLYDVAGDLAAVLRRTELDEEIVELRTIVGR